MMQGYAGPVQQGDMVVRANEVSPGITALLSKQNRKGAQGIYELPSAKQPAPNYYNMALDNVQNEIRSAARTVNAMAPEGERLAYINPQEEGILKLLGGSGEPEPVTGIPSFAPPGRGTTLSSAQKAFKEKYSKPGGKTKTTIGRELDKLMSASPKTPAATGGGMGPQVGPADRSFQLGQAGFEAAAQRAKEEGTPGALATYLGAMSGVGKDYKPGGQVGPYSAEQAARVLSEMTGDVASASEARNKLYMDALKQSMMSYAPYTGKSFFGLGERTLVDDDAKDIYRAAVAPYKEKNILEKALEKVQDFSIVGNLMKMFGAKSWDEMSFDERLQALRNQTRLRKEQEERDRRSGRDSQAAPAEIIEEEVPTEEEEELPYFSYYRRFRQPMTYQDIIRRAYEGSDGPLLETLQEAMDRDTE